MEVIDRTATIVDAIRMTILTVARGAGLAIVPEVDVLTPYHSLVSGAKLTPDQTILVIGAGGLGLNTIQIAKHVTASRPPWRLELTTLAGLKISTRSSRNTTSFSIPLLISQEVSRWTWWGVPRGPTT